MASYRIRFLKKVVIFSIFFLLFLGNGLFAQQAGEFEICYQTIDVRKVDKGKCNFLVRWCLTRNGIQVPVTTITGYRVYCSLEDTIFSEREAKDVVGCDTVIFDNIQYGKKYFFKVKGLLDSQKKEWISSSIWEKPAQLADYHPPSYWYSLALKFFRLFGIDRDIYKNSTGYGKMAFEVLSIFFLLGIIIWFSRTWIILKSIKILPLENEADGIIDHQIMVLLSKKSLDENELKRLTRFRITREKFHGKLAWIYKKLTAILEGLPLLNLKGRREKKLNDLPAVKIFASGVSAFEKGKDVEDALEFRASAELETLRKRSLIDLLWALGVIAPLLGLFGTVTGLSASFAEVVAKYSPGVEQAVPLNDLAKGIFEALWTTIFGLIVGILFMLAYYYYNYKLDRIYSTWEIFSADFLDKFIYK